MTKKKGSVLWERQFGINWFVTGLEWPPHSANAVRRVQGQSRGREKSVQPNSTSPWGQSGKTEPTVTVEKMLLLVVINCAARVKYKTDQIKMIIKGAEKIFGVKNISEHINKGLEGARDIRGEDHKKARRL